MGDINCQINHPRWSSRKLAIIGVGLLNFNVLLWFGAISPDQALDGTKWLLGVGLGSFALEDSAKRFTPFRLK